MSDYTTQSYIFNTVQSTVIGPSDEPALWFQTPTWYDTDPPFVLCTHQDLNLSIVVFTPDYSTRILTISGIDAYTVLIDPDEAEFLMENYRGVTWRGTKIWACEQSAPNYRDSNGTVEVRRYSVAFSSPDATITRDLTFTAPVRNLKNPNATVLAVSYHP